MRDGARCAEYYGNNRAARTKLRCARGGGLRLEIPFHPGLKAMIVTVAGEHGGITGKGLDVTPQDGVDPQRNQRGIAVARRTGCLKAGNAGLKAHVRLAVDRAEYMLPAKTRMQVGRIAV